VKVLVETGTNINVCLRADAQYALGDDVCALQQAWDHGIKPGFSVDNETSYSGYMFREMRVAFYLQRALVQFRKFFWRPAPAQADHDARPALLRDHWRRALRRPRWQLSSCSSPLTTSTPA
jgi:5-methylthioadenosine/S-adenosylhomocysteine deaminase